MMDREDADKYWNDFTTIAQREQQEKVKEIEEEGRKWLKGEIARKDLEEEYEKKGFTLKKAPEPDESESNAE